MIKIDGLFHGDESSKLIEDDDYMLNLVSEIIYFKYKNKKILSNKNYLNKGNIVNIIFEDHNLIFKDASEQVKDGSIIVSDISLNNDINIKKIKDEYYRQLEFVNRALLMDHNIEVLSTLISCRDISINYLSDELKAKAILAGAEVRNITFDELKPGFLIIINEILDSDERKTVHNYNPSLIRDPELKEKFLKLYTYSKHNMLEFI